MLPDNKSEISIESYFDRAVSISLFALVIIWTALLFSNHWVPDISWWAGWARSLQNGIAISDANYPPFFLYWLFLGGKIWHQYALTAPTDIVVKTFISVPLLAGYIFVIESAANYAKNNSNTRAVHLAVLIAAVSPAVLYDAASWGQVDIIIYPFVMLSILSILQKHPYQSGFWFALALGSKMQAVFFAPTLLGAILFSRLFFARWVISFILGSTILWLPWILQGNLWRGLKSAYLDNLHNQPVMNVDATNFWHLLGLGSVPIHKPIFGFSEQLTIWGLSIPAPSLFLLAVLTVGIFSIISMWIAWRNPDRIWQCATLNCAAAFAFAPSMHERYLIPALLPALFAVIKDPKQLFVFCTLTLCSLVNIIIVLQPGGDGIWFLCSAIVVTIPIILSLDLFGRLNSILRLVTSKIHWLRLAAWATPLVFLFCSTVIPYISGLNRTFWKISDLALISSSQSWGGLNRNRSVTNDTISIAGKKFDSGLGTHADSTIEVAVPELANSFCTLAGVQDGTNGKGLVFSILLDGVLTWNSEALSSGEIGVPICLDVKDHKVLTLIVKGTDSPHGAHANWADAAFLVSEKSP